MQIDHFTRRENVLTFHCRDAHGSQMMITLDVERLAFMGQAAKQSAGRKSCVARKAIEVRWNPSESERDVLRCQKDRLQILRARIAADCAANRTTWIDLPQRDTPVAITNVRIKRGQLMVQERHREHGIWGWLTITGAEVVRSVENEQEAVS